MCEGSGWELIKGVSHDQMTSLVALSALALFLLTSIGHHLDPHEMATIPLLRYLQPEVQHILSSSATLGEIRNRVFSLVLPELVFSLALEAVLPVLLDNESPVSRAGTRASEDNLSTYTFCK